MISKDEITAVIPTHNRLFELERCIRSILPYVKEVLVIDNNSNEDIQSLEKKFEDVHVFTVGYNMGPCKAQNWGVELSETPYVLLLDNDVECLKWEDIYMGDYKAVRAFRILGDKYFYMYSNDPDHPDWHQVLPWFYGCANLVNKKLWEEVGGYNEDYFAYYQECDISAKFWKKGYYISYNPSIVFVHHDSETERNHEKIAYWRARNVVWFCCEHLPLHLAILQTTKVILSSGKNIKYALKGLVDALKHLPKRDPIYDEFFLKVWRR